MVTVAVLGPVVIHRADRDVQLRAGKAAQLLVRLALEAGTVVGADRLIEDLWTDDAVVTARNTLQAKVSRLRRALGDGALVTGGTAGYSLELPPAAIDALEALRLTRVAAARRATGDAAASLDAAAAGLALFSGDALPGAGDGGWVQPYRVRLEEAHAALAEDDLAARLELDGTGVVGELEEQVRRQPLREGLWALLITALYRAGRQGDAVAAYERVRVQLVQELGLDPGPELQQVLQRVLSQDSALPVRPLPVQDRRAGNLPSMRADLVGRATELARVRELLGRSRLVQITGPGGVGKTATALAAAGSLAGSDAVASGDLVRDGVWLARLEAAVSGADVVDALVAALHVPGGETALLERLAGAQALIVLDNCEHVLEEAAALALRVLDAAPGVRVLCTSQVPLDVDGSLVIELAPLPVTDAAELFRRRAERIRGVEDTSADPAVRDLCLALDGLPLAIELAAARTRTMGVAEIRRRLDDRFAVLTDPTSRRPDRRRSLRSTIGWSYDLLFPDDRRGLWALAAFAGGAALPALADVLTAADVPGPVVADVVDRLVHRSLVLVERTPAPGADDVVRYRLLDSIRAFARDAAADAGLAERLAEGHADWVARRADASTAGVRGHDQAEHLALALVERTNIDAALAWCADHDGPRALQIARGFGWAWVVLGDSRGADRLHTALRAAGEAAPPAERADALLLAAWIQASTGDLQPAREHLTAAAELARAADDALLQARALYHLSYVVSHGGDFEAGLELAERAGRLLDSLDEPWHRVAAALFAARAATSAGKPERAAAALARVQSDLPHVADAWLRCRFEGARGELARLERRFDDAVEHLRRAVQASTEHGYQQTEAYQVTSLGRAQCQSGDYRAGAATLALAVGKAEGTGDPRLAALGRVHLARVLRAVGDTLGARAAAESAVSWYRAAGGGEQALLGECLLAALDAESGVAEARGRLLAVVRAARASGDAPVAVLALDALGRLSAADQDSRTAQRLWEEADRWMVDASHFITEQDRRDAPRTSATACVNGTLLTPAPASHQGPPGRAPGPRAVG